MIALFSKRNKSINFSQGFTLIEVILVMFLVSFVFTGIYATLAKTAQHEKDDRYAIIASNLAQEGVEMIRNRRDENLLKEIDMDNDLSTGTCYPYWDGGVADCDNTARIDSMELKTGVYRNCPKSGCTGDSIFSRSCDIGVPNPPNDSKEALEVDCVVSWKSPSLGTNKQIKIESYLTNWQENI